MAKSEDDLFELLAKAAQERANAEAAKIKNSLAVSDALAIISGSGKSSTEAIQSFTDANVVVKSETDAMAARVDAANAQAKLDLGTDSTQGNYRLKELAGDRKTAYENAVKAEEIIYEKKSKTFASDPLGWIHAQITTPADIDVYNHFAKRHNMAEEEYNSIVTSTTATAQMNNATKATTSAAMADANLKMVVAAGQKELANNAVLYAQHNIQGQQVLSSLSEKQLGHAESAVRMEEAAQNFKLRQQQMALNSAQRAETLKRTQLLNEQLEGTIQDRTQLKLEQESLTTSYNSGVRALGGVELSTPQVLTALKNDKSGYVGNLLRYGQDIEANGGSKAGVPVLGPGMSPADMTGVLRAARAKPNGIDKDVYEFAVTATGDAIRALGATLDKDPAKRAQQLAVEIKKAADTQLERIDNSKDSSNIYGAPTPRQLAEAIPVLTKYPKLQEIIKRSSDNPNVPIRDVDILEAAKIELQTNPTKENFKLISDSLGDYYRAVRDYNNIHNGYLEKNLPQQRTYNAVLPTGLFGGTQVTDMTDPLQVQRLLIKMSFGMQSSFAPTN